MATIQVLGRLTREPAQRQVNQSTVTEISIASDTSRKDEQGNAIAAFYRASFWNNTGTAIMNYFHKGSPIFVAGELEPREYQDNNGNNRISLDINHASFSFVPAPPRNSQNGGQRQNNSQQGNFNQGMNNQPQFNQNGSQGQNNGFNVNQFNQGGQPIDPKDLPFPPNNQQQGQPDNQQFNHGQQPQWNGQPNNR